VPDVGSADSSYPRSFSRIPSPPRNGGFPPLPECWQWCFLSDPSKLPFLKSDYGGFSRKEYRTPIFIRQGFVSRFLPPWHSFFFWYHYSPFGIFNSGPFGDSRLLHWSSCCPQCTEPVPFFQDHLPKPQYPTDDTSTGVTITPSLGEAFKYVPHFG